MQALFLLFLLILTFCGTDVQAPANSVRAVEDHVILQRRKIVLVRSAQLAKRFPSRKTASVTHPVVRGPGNDVVLRRVRSALDFKNIFGYSLDDYRNDSWLTEFSYVVNYNSNYLFDITFTQSGLAAYPDEQSKHFLINLRDGSIIKARDVFESDKLKSIAAMVDTKLQSELEQIEKENASSNADSQDKESIRGAYEELKFEVQNLDDFSVGRIGITFLYDAGFPHVFKAFEPQGRYFFNYAQLKPYLKDDGPLGQFIR